MADHRKTIIILACTQAQAQAEAFPIIKALPQSVRDQIVPLCLTTLDVIEKTGIVPLGKDRSPSSRQRGH